MSMERPLPLMWSCLILSAALTAERVAAVPPPVGIFSALASDKFAEREKAQADLLEWSRKQPTPAIEWIFVQFQTSPDPEVRARCLDVLRELVTDEYFRTGEGYIGISLRDEVAKIPGEANPRNAIRIAMVEAESPGAQAGILPNDLILGIEQKEAVNVGSQQLFQEEIRKRNPGNKVSLRVLRGEKIHVLVVTLGRRPASADMRFFDGNPIDLEVAEKAAREAYFQRWLDGKKSVR
jgi:PDZ domain